MIAEAKQSYRGVIYFHQPTPLTPAAESKEQKHKVERKLRKMSSQFFPIR